jgi:hypothetical protein
MGLYNPQKDTHMANHKMDPLQGLNADQSGPLDKIQNGDPRSSPNRDQRSHCIESGGPAGSLQKEPTLGSNRGSVIEPVETEAVFKGTIRSLPEGVSGETEASDANDRSGQASYIESGQSLKETTDGDQGATKTTLPDDQKGADAA